MIVFLSELVPDLDEAVVHGLRGLQSEDRCDAGHGVPVMTQTNDGPLFLCELREDEWIEINVDGDLFTDCIFCNVDLQPGTFVCETKSIGSPVRIVDSPPQECLEERHNRRFFWVVHRMKQSIRLDVRLTQYLMLVPKRKSLTTMGLMGPHGQEPNVIGGIPTSIEFHSYPLLSDVGWRNQIPTFGNAYSVVGQGPFTVDAVVDTDAT
jgi:hypothetical protein